MTTLRPPAMTYLAAPVLPAGVGADRRTVSRPPVVSWKARCGFTRYLVGGPGRPGGWASCWGHDVLPLSVDDPGARVTCGSRALVTADKGNDPPQNDRSLSRAWVRDRSSTGWPCTHAARGGTGASESHRVCDGGSDPYLAPLPPSNPVRFRDLGLQAGGRQSRWVVV